MQLAVLVLSILAVLCNLLWIWGFIILRILGLFYVKKQVSCSTRVPACWFWAACLLHLPQYTNAHASSEAITAAGNCMVGSESTQYPPDVVKALMVQVAAIEAGTREPAPARVVAENDMVQQALARHRLPSAPSAVPPDAPSPQLSRSRRLWNWVKRVKRPSKQVCAASNGRSASWAEALRSVTGLQP